jgi:hypothetical protein
MREKVRRGLVRGERAEAVAFQASALAKRMAEEAARFAEM